jgi:hypothetical protein
MAALKVVPQAPEHRVRRTLERVHQQKVQQPLPVHLKRAELQQGQALQGLGVLLMPFAAPAPAASAAADLVVGGLSLLSALPV